MNIDDFRNSYFFDFLESPSIYLQSYEVHGPMYLYVNGSLPFSYIEEGSFLNITEGEVTVEVEPGYYYLIIDNTNVATYPQSNDKTDNGVFI